MSLPNSHLTKDELELVTALSRKFSCFKVWNEYSETLSEDVDEQIAALRGRIQQWTNYKEDCEKALIVKEKIAIRTQDDDTRKQLESECKVLRHLLSDAIEAMTRVEQCIQSKEEHKAAVVQGIHNHIMDATMRLYTLGMDVRDRQLLNQE